MLFHVVGTRLNNTDKTKMLNVVRTVLLGIRRRANGYWQYGEPSLRKVIHIIAIQEESMSGVLMPRQYCCNYIVRT